MQTYTRNLKDQVATVQHQSWTVLGDSVTNYSADFGSYGCMVTGTNPIDVGNVHLYSGGADPTTNMDTGVNRVGQEQKISGGPGGSSDGCSAPQQPIWVTEYGQHDQVDNGTSYYIGYNADAVYQDREVLDWYNRSDNNPVLSPAEKADRSYVYELFDQNSSTSGTPDYETISDRSRRP